MKRAKQTGKQTGAQNGKKWVWSALLLLAALAALAVWQGRRASRANVSRVDVYQGSALYASVPFPPAQAREIRVQGENGEENVIVVDSGGVYMLHATCTGQDCVAQGRVTAENRDTRPLSGWIICLPNRVSIELK